MKRNLSSIYIKYNNPKTKKWESWCFEDVPEETQYELLKSKKKSWIIELIEKLRNCYNECSKAVKLGSKMPDVDNTDYKHFFRDTSKTDLIQFAINEAKFLKVLGEIYDLVKE